MLEKIGNMAERLATNVSESRRGFLARLGQAALGVAGALGALLTLPAKAQARKAQPPPGYTQGICEVLRTGGPTGEAFYYTGICVSSDCAFGVSNRCRGAAPLSRLYLCGRLISRTSPCSF